MFVELLRYTESKSIQKIFHIFFIQSWLTQCMQNMRRSHIAYEQAPV